MTEWVMLPSGHGSALAKKRMNEVDCNIHCLGKSGVVSYSSTALFERFLAAGNAQWLDHCLS